MKKLYFILFTSIIGFASSQAPTANSIMINTSDPSQINNVIFMSSYVSDNGGGIDFSTFDLDVNMPGYQHSLFQGLFSLSFDPSAQTLSYLYSGPGCQVDGALCEYKISSLSGEESLSSQIMMSVNPFAFPPSSTDDFYTIYQGETFSFNPTINDFSNHNFGFSGISVFNTTPIANSWTTDFNQTITFTPDANFTGIATALYSTLNTCGNSNDGLITIEVLSVNPVDPDPTSGIFGKVFRDENINCIVDNFDIGIQNVNLIIQPGNIIVQTNENGIWILDTLADGDYQVTASLPNNLWETTCDLTQNFTVANGNVLVPAKIGINYVNECAQPNISITMPTIRRCFSNQYVYVTAFNDNNATGTLNNAYAEVELDPLLTVFDATISYTSIGDNKYRFDLGNLAIGQSINFTITTTVSCGSNLGQTLCLEAKLFPAEGCAVDTVIENPTFPAGVTPCSLPWDNSSLSVDGWCANDSIYFTVTNTGEFGNGDMDCFSPVRIYIDGQMYQFDSIRLLGQETATFAFAGTGQTWRLEADQHPLHPGNSHPNANVELCGDAANWTPGLVTILPQDDADPVVDIYCGIVSGSYDPNDKQGFPLGLGQNHEIMPNQNLEYMIRFQNTGTDTAFTVVIRDTLDFDLDIFSVVSGVSSHNYNFTMHGPRVLEWTFNNILLPDSTTNLEASNGFVTFSVQQNTDLPNGTQITNSAGIYFDFNDPIITNQTLHTINSCIQNTTLRTLNESVCETYLAPDGQVYTQSGTYTAIIPNHLACDSIITINLTIKTPTSATLVENTCQTYTAPDGQIYSQSGTYTAIVPNANGCDSTITIDLTVNNPTVSSFTESVCQSFIAPDGQIYTQSGTYTATIPNSNGCDSIITINLIVFNASSSTIIENTCQSYTAPDGQIYSQSGVYTAVLPNSVSCDSIITINLTVNNSTFSSNTQFACQSYTAPDGQIYTESGAYVAVIPNANGCDSTITFNLTVNNVDNSISQNGMELLATQNGATYQWVDCANNNEPIVGATNQSYTAIENGEYAVQVTFNNCTERSECLLINGVGIKENTNDFVKIYPNPTQDVLHVVFEENKPYEIKILDINGKLIQRIFTNEQSIVLNLESLTSGVYLFQIGNSETTVTERITKL